MIIASYASIDPTPKGKRDKEKLEKSLYPSLAISTVGNRGSLGTGGCHCLDSASAAAILTKS